MKKNIAVGDRIFFIHGLNNPSYMSGDVAQIQYQDNVIDGSKGIVIDFESPDDSIQVFATNVVKAISGASETDKGMYGSQIVDETNPTLAELFS